MSAPDRSMRSALGRVRHHGASGEGTGHFIATRVTSIALAILAPWFVVNAALSIRDASYTATIDFLSQPVNAVGVILLVAVSFYHMSIGLQETITMDDSASLNGSLAALVRSKAVLLESAMAHAYDKSGLSALVGRA